MIRLRAFLGVVFSIAALAVFASACVPPQQYEPLQLTSLESGQSSSMAIFGNAVWRDTGIQITQGQAYRVSASGSWSMSPFCGPTGSEGLAAEHLMCMKGIFAASFPLPEGRIGALVGKIGQSGKVFVVGGTEGFIADRSGTLFLRTNDPDGFLWDNTGQIDVAVRRYDGGGQTTGGVVASNKKATDQQSNQKSESDPTPQAAVQKPGGYYSAEQDIAFNVLENVSFDPASGELIIAGRFDPEYAGPRIPYLQHMAVFLEHAGPQVSLDWTPEFERKVDQFFRRMDDETEMANLIGSGQLMDDAGRITEKGRLFLPLFGFNAYHHGRAAGSLGVETRYKDLSIVEITRVVPGSAADNAGLRVGDEIHMLMGADEYPHQPYAPNSLYRAIRYAGAGAEVTLTVSQNGNFGGIPVVLDAYPGDSWEHVTKYDVNAHIFRAGGYGDIAQVLTDIDRMIRLEDTDAGLQMMWLLLYTINVADWAEENRHYVMNGQMAQDDFMNQLSRRMTQGIEWKIGITDNSMTNAYDRYFAQTGNGWGASDAALEEMNRALAPLLKESLRTALHQNDQVTMPVAVLDPSTNFSPTVTPRFIDLPPDSELARLFVEADYVGKAIIHQPELSERIPAYQTEYAFSESQPGAVSESTNRLWIEPARIDVHRSGNDSTLRFGRTDMRINIGRAIGGGAERRDEAYGQFLTSLYDDLAKEFHQLHELREAAKIKVAARWIQSRARGFRLPREGRTRVSLPQTLEGFVTLIWSPHRVKVSLIAPGGIDFNVPPIGPSGPVFPDDVTVNIPPDPSVVDFSDRVEPDLPRVDPAMFSSPSGQPAIPERYRRPLTIPPVPSSVRLVGLATKGQRMLDRLSALKTQAAASPGRCNAEQSRALRDKLAIASAIAKQLNGVERALNAITSQLPERQRTIEAVNKTLHDEPRRIRDAARDMWTAGLLDMYDQLEGSVQMRSIQDFETLIAHMKQAKDKLDELSGDLSNLDLILGSAMASSLPEREQATQNLLSYLKDTIGDASKLKGNDAVTRAFRVAGKTTGAVDKVVAIMEINASTYKLLDALDTLERLDAQSEQEVSGLRDKLLPLQRDLSDKLDTAMKDPLVQTYDSGTGKFDCGAAAS